MRGLPPLVIPAVLIRSILVVGAFQASAIVTLILSSLFPATFLGRGTVSYAKEGATAVAGLH